MATPVVMPRLGESVVEGTVARWLKRTGEPVAKLEPLLEISTDKIDTEIPAPAGGTLLEIRIPEGSTVRAGTVLAMIGEPTEAPAGQELPAAPSVAPSAAPSAPENPSIAAEATPDGSAQHGRPAGRAFVSPVVKRIAREHAVDLEQVAGTGLQGRVTKQDILAHVSESNASPALTAETVHPLSTMRRAIAQHMVRSVQISPHVTTIFEADLTAVVRHREAHKDEFARRGIRLSLTPYFMSAVAAALRVHPRANSRYTDVGIVESARVHVGVAVALADGLLVPVVRDADELSLSGMARAVEELAARARSGTLAPDDLSGGTFTITNHGVSGSLIGTPIINQPQSGILGIGAIAKRAVVRSASASLLPDADDAIVIRPMAYLSYSFDHRLLDGASADAFVSEVKRRLEGWPPEA